MSVLYWRMVNGYSYLPYNGAVPGGLPSANIPSLPSPQTLAPASLPAPLQTQTAPLASPLPLYNPASALKWFSSSNGLPAWPPNALTGLSASSCQLLISISDGSATLQIQLISFDNNRQRFDGKICDGVVQRECDHFFTFCVDDLQQTGFDIAKCNYYGPVTGGEYMNTQRIDFDNNAKFFDNPITVTFGLWPGGVAFKVFVQDRDTFITTGANDPVDQYIINLVPPSVPSNIDNITTLLLKQSEQTAIGNRSKEPTSLKFRYAVICNPYFYSADCSVYCNEEVSQGKYTCDSTTGVPISSVTTQTMPTPGQGTDAIPSTGTTTYKVTSATESPNPSTGTTDYKVTSATESPVELPIWVFVVIIIGSVAVITVFIVILICCCRQRDKPPLSPGSYIDPQHPASSRRVPYIYPNGHELHGYNGGSQVSAEYDYIKSQTSGSLHNI